MKFASPQGQVANNELHALLSQGPRQVHMASASPYRES